MVKGGKGFGGELGHVLIPYQSIPGIEGLRPDCNCGRIGDLESLCSLTAIRRTLDQEMEANPRVLMFGEDIGPKGGVHAVTLGLQEKFGRERLFDTSLNEEGIIGRAVGMALAGLMPVPEIQFRKYSEPATEQIHDCGTMRWRTNNRYAAPMVLRIPGGFFKCGDPWHSQTNEVQFVHNPGWKVAVPSNAEDAVGLSHDFDGFITAEWLRKNTPIENAEFYLCGPKPFLRALVPALAREGVSSERVHFEFFGPSDELIAA